MRTAGELIRLYYQALDHRRLDDLEELFAPEATSEIPGRLSQGVQAIRAGLAAAYGLGLHTDHVIGHLLESGPVAICELRSANRVKSQTFSVSGAVVVEAANGKILRLVAYPQAVEFAAFRAGMAAAAASSA